jgi:hypothetical protein
MAQPHIVKMCSKKRHQVKAPSPYDPTKGRGGPNWIDLHDSLPRQLLVINQKYNSTHSPYFDDTVPQKTTAELPVVVPTKGRVLQKSGLLQMGMNSKKTITRLLAEARV